MARKELVIAIKAVDQISAPIRRTMTAIGRMGRQAIDTTGRVLRSMGGLARSLLNVRTLFAGLAAAFAAAALVRSILRVAEGLDRTAKAARSLGIEVEEYSKLEFAADRSGIAVNQLAKAFITVQRNAAQYVRGEGGAAVRAFADLGANLTDANGRVKQGTALLEAILDPISKIQDEAVKTSKLYDIFGRTGAQFKNIGGDLVNLLRDAERYGSITRNQTVVAEAFQDSLTNLGRAWTFLRASVLEAIGPALTNAINTAAEKMADFGRLVGGVFQAFVATANDPETRQAIGNAVSSLLFDVSEIVQVGIVALVRSTGVLLQNSIEPLLILIRNTLGPSLGNVIIETVGEALAKVYDWMGRAPGAPALSRFFNDLAQQTRDGIAYLKEEMGSGGELRQAFDESLTNSLKGAGSRVQRDIADILNESFTAIHRIASRDIRGLNEIIDQLVGRLSAVQAQVNNDMPTKGITWWGHFTNGVREAAEAVGTMQAQFKQLGSDVYNVVGNQITTGLSDLATGAAKAKDAFRDMAKGILDDITRLLIRMAVFNALSSAFGSFGARGGGATTSTSETVGSGFSTAFANKGGFIAARGSVLRLNGGGGVPGPNINRDMVPALLTPGEFVVNRRGVKNAGTDRLHALNRGEGGGAFSFTFAPVINMGGGGSPTSARQATEAMKAVFLDLFARDPSFRDQVRARLT